MLNSELFVLVVFNSYNKLLQLISPTMLFIQRISIQVSWQSNPGQPCEKRKDFLLLLQSRAFNALVLILIPGLLVDVLCCCLDGQLDLIDQLPREQLKKVSGSNLGHVSVFGLLFRLLLVLLEVLEDVLDDGDDGDALWRRVLVVDPTDAILAND